MPRLVAALAVLLSTLAVPASAGAQTVWPPYGPIPPGTQITIPLGLDNWTESFPTPANCPDKPTRLHLGGVAAGGLVELPGVHDPEAEGVYWNLPNPPSALTLPPIQLVSWAESADNVYVEAAVSEQCEFIPGRFAAVRNGRIVYCCWSVVPGATLPPGGPSNPGGGPGGGPAKCPEAAGLLASARYWNEVAQRHRGRSVEAHKAVIDYWGKASAAFYAVLGIAAADLPGNAISKGTAEHLARKETLDGYRQLWENSLNGKWREISRQLRVLQELRKFLKALGPIGKLDATLHAAESLYWLGLAAQQGVLRDKQDAIADAALANATDDQRRAARACGAGASQHRGAAVAAATARGKARYTKLVRPRAVKGLRLSPRPGLSRGTVRALNALLAGEERAVALAGVVGESTSRALAAEKARKNTWRNRQLRHARTTARKLASHLDALIRRRRQVAGSLGGQAREARSLELSDPAKLGKLLRKLGLPNVVTASAKRLGLKPRVLRRMFTTPPAGQLTLPSLADAVADPAGAARDRAWAAELRRFAAGP
jgi:hypothetical protein